jgi:N-acetylneuraminic acid mutarotase
MNRIIECIYCFGLLFGSEVASFGQNTWSVKMAFPNGGRVGMCGFSIGNKGFFGTGYDNSFINRSDFWEWDQLSNVWTQKANVGGSPRSFAAAFSINGNGYIGTGYDSLFNVTNDFWEYDTLSNSWQQRASLPAPARNAAVGFSIGMKGYISTGDDGNSQTVYYNDLWEYDPLTDQWTPRANFPGQARTNAVGFSIGNKGYLGTGYYGPPCNDFWEWDQSTDTWTSKPAFPGGARWGSIGFSIGNQGFIGTGKDAHANIYRDFWEFDPFTNAWAPRPSVLGASRWIATGLAINGKGYVLGGANASFSTFYNSYYEYSPAPAAFQEEDSGLKFSLYPNPAQDFIKITLLDHCDAEDWEMIDVHGIIVQRGRLEDQGITIICLSALREGVYFFRTNETKGLGIKLIKQ